MIIKNLTGTFSDVSILGDTFDKCSVNLSIGYYNEHTRHEYLKVNELYQTISKVKNILLEHDRQQVFTLPEYKATEHVKAGYYYSVHRTDYNMPVNDILEQWEHTRQKIDRQKQKDNTFYDCYCYECATTVNHVDLNYGRCPYCSSLNIESYRTGGL